MTVGADPVQVALDRLQADFSADLAALKAAIAPPPPPPPPAAPVRFSRRSYGGSLDPTDATRQSIIFVQADSAGVRLAEQVHDQELPIDVYVYVSLGVVAENDGAGNRCLVPWGLADANENWFQHRAGSRVRYPHTSREWIVNPADPKLQLAAAGNVKRIMELAPWAGIFADNTFGEVVWIGGATSECPTNASLRTGISGLLGAALGPLRANGTKVIANIPGDKLAAIQSYSQLIDGFEQESFTDGGAGIAQQVDQGFYAQTLAQVALGEQLGLIVNLHSALSGRDTLDRRSAFGFFLASALLVAGPGTFCETDGQLTDGTVNLWFPDCDAALALGNPAAPFTLSGGLYRRPFEHGAVTLDTNTLTYSIG